MKKHFLLAAALCAQAGAFAQGTSAEPEIIPEFYVMKMSNDGKYLVSETQPETMDVYQRTTGEFKTYQSCTRGLGNSFATNGTLVGSTLEDNPFILTDGKLNTPANLTNYVLCNFSAITADGSRICGLINNPESSGSDDESKLMYLPMYVDVTGDKVSEPVVLPYPEKDFCNLTPQYCTAVWISDDGRTILGQVIDYTGMMPYPIVYRQGEDGKWSYTLPTGDLMNPNHLTLPVLPAEPEQPLPEDYMDADAKARYEADLEAWQMSGYDPELYPEPTDYMTEEKKNQWTADFNNYRAEAEKYNELLMEHDKIRARIFEDSTPFIQNALAMNTAGTMAASTSKKSKAGEFEPINYFTMFIIDLTDGTYRTIETGTQEILPGQITADGSLVCSSTPSGDVCTRGYIVKKGSDKLMPIEDYLAGINPAFKTWMSENLSFPTTVEENGELVEKDVIASGLITVSDDMSIVAGAVPSYLIPTSEFIYMTYVFDNLTAGIDGTVADTAGSVKMMDGGIVMIDGTVSDLRIMDLGGRTLVNINEATGSINTGLHAGIYVISYSAMGEHKTSKVMLRK